MRTRAADALVFLGILAAALLIYWPVFGIQPLRGDNLHVLAWAHQAPWWSLGAVDAAIYPEWRPLAYLTVWLEYQLVSIAGVPFYFFTNLMVWAGCASLVYRIVDELTGARLAALLAAAWLLFDRRAIDSLGWIIERQTTLACACGLLAIYILARARQRGITTREALVVAALLLASALSKEYGLAFAVAVAIYGVVRGSQRKVVAAAAAVIVYVTARAIFAGGAVNTYCEDMGFFFSTTPQCINPYSAQGLAQMAYNAVATVIGTLVPGLFGAEGAVQPDYWRAVRGVGALLLAAAGAYAGGPIVRMVSLLPLLNGMLSVALYRERNQLIGACAVAIAVGVAVAMRPWSEAPRRQVVLQTAAVGFLLLVLAVRVSDAHTEISTLRDNLTLDLDPCDSSVRERPFGDTFVRLVKQHYGMENPGCK